ncbi:thioredoxin [Lethenteron reissneri]|uniref:thioredoxin n=1 Tax=Lethenteron reissneri TaxID=7753 RepID=UPI002AB787C6|nr:thioredoxin [Lethenteron reissneri]
MGVTKLNNKEEYKQILEQNKHKLVVIDFSATWCGPCKVISPIFHDFANEYHNVVFCVVDVDDAADIAELCGIKAMPTFIFFKNNEKVGEVMGANKDHLEKTLKELM